MSEDQISGVRELVARLKRELAEAKAQRGTLLAEGNCIDPPKWTPLGEQLVRLEAERERLRAALAGLIEAVRDTELSAEQWESGQFGWRMSAAYKCLDGMHPAQIAALAAHEPATPGPALTAEASPEASGGRELLQEAHPMTDQQIMYMVSRFLGWRLPENFQPDNGISFNAEYNVEYNAYRGLPPSRRQPYGTNLLDGTQAEAMVRYMVAGMPSPEPVTGTRQETLREAVERLRAIKCEHGASPLTCPKCHPELAEPYEPPPAACPSPIGGKETQAAGQCGCEEKP